ncbi:MAG TPA: caspase family protein [Pirellulales bacterium]
MLLAQAVAAEPTTRLAAGKKSALLIGCTRYERLPESFQLEGPANDVVLMRRVLETSYGFSSGAIRTLAEGASAAGRPTRANIAAEFERLIQVAGPGDQIVVLLSGHGSQQLNVPDPAHPDPDDRDGWDETFLPADVERLGTQQPTVRGAIVDDELFVWCRQIVDRGATLWAIFDCCHSGEGIRGDSQERSRHVPPKALGIGRSVDDTAAEPAAAKAEIPFDVQEPIKRLVVFYACQSSEDAIERPMPYGDEPATRREPYGLFTYTLCSILQGAGHDELSYHDLAAAVWARYRAWGRYGPTPYADGVDLDHAVLNTHRPERRYLLEANGTSQWKLNAGDLDGLRPGAVLAVYPPGRTGTDGEPTDDLPAGSLGYVGVRELGALDAVVVPIRPDSSIAKFVPDKYQRHPAPAQLPSNCDATLAYLDYGEMRLAVAVDVKQPELDPDARRSLEKLAAELAERATRPKAVFRLVPQLDDARWVIQHRDGLVLVPEAVAMAEPGVPLPAESPRFELPAGDAAATCVARLERLFRAENLLKLCVPSGSHLGDESEGLDFTVEMVRYRDKRDREGSVLQTRPPVIYPGQFVGWRVTNHDTDAIDFTLLYIDANFEIQALFPRMDAIGANNRLFPEKSFATRPFPVTAKPLGNEQLVVIATRAKGPPKDFRALASADIEQAKGVETAQRGTADNVLESPLGRLMSYAVFDAAPGAGSGLRGLGAEEMSQYELRIVPWRTLSAAGN